MIMMIKIDLLFLYVKQFMFLNVLNEAIFFSDWQIFTHSHTQDPDLSVISNSAPVKMSTESFIFIY